MRKWKSIFNGDLTYINEKKVTSNFYDKSISNLLDLKNYGFYENKNKIEPFKLNSKIIEEYAETRNFPSLNSTSKIGPYLRFGTVSIRKVVSGLLSFKDETFLNELIWREFFMQILYHFLILQQIALNLNMIKLSG